MRPLLALIAVILVAWGGCTSDPTGEIGDACEDHSDCLSDYCAPRKVCTATCMSHEDCGCLAVDDSQVGVHRCTAVCVFDPALKTEGKCAKLCNDSLDCTSPTACAQVNKYFSACTAG